MSSKNHVWIRLPTNQGLKPILYVTIGTSECGVWIRLPTNQGLKLSGIWIVYGTVERSESDFQQIKDWNSGGGVIMPFKRIVWIRLPTNQGLKHGSSWFYGPGDSGLNPTSNKSRIETANRPRISVRNSGLNPTSNKSRIETSGRHIADGGKSRLNPTSNKSRIETDCVPCRQHRGDAVSESDFQQIKDWNLGTSQMLCPSNTPVWIRLPTNQGLKLRLSAME